ncbi:hypothetical protein FUAX_35060 [Fulvitalea axinellae]|uniref:Uncharacterized protein n=1 Tax=Fulvitalea axinellae TaxID=1182444 RepID=A0AAU9D926_9BACT|nr:hypothetical protein FUAX_35060 [Fulvitalea axinellae]
MSDDWRHDKRFLFLLEDYSGTTDIDASLDLEYDLGLTGDDAVEFFEEYEKTFNVDMAGFNLSDYFHSEGENALLWLKKSSTEERRRSVC